MTDWRTYKVGDLVWVTSSSGSDLVPIKQVGNKYLYVGKYKFCRNTGTFLGRKCGIAPYLTTREVQELSYLGIEVRARLTDAQLYGIVALMKREPQKEEG